MPRYPYTDEPVLRHTAYTLCLLCEAKMPLPTVGYVRKHYRDYHLISKRRAIDALLLSAEKAAGIEQEGARR